MHPLPGPTLWRMAHRRGHLRRGRSTRHRSGALGHLVNAVRGRRAGRRRWPRALQALERSVSSEFGQENSHAHGSADRSRDDAPPRRCAALGGVDARPPPPMHVVCQDPSDMIELMHLTSTFAGHAAHGLGVVQESATGAAQVLVDKTTRSQPPLKAIVRLKDLRLKAVRSGSKRDMLSDENAPSAYYLGISSGSGTSNSSIYLATGTSCSSRRAPSSAVQDHTSSSSARA